MRPALAPHVLAFINALTALSPEPQAIWVVGSQANGPATASSDTDLLVFGSVPFLNAVLASVQPPTGIDCFVLFDGNNFRDPWRNKTGSLSEWEWKTHSPDEANYVGTKWIEDEEFGMGLGDLMCLNEKAIRVWPSP